MPPRPNQLLDWLFNPFLFVAGLPALGAGLALLLLNIGLAQVAGMHFDGLLHIGLGPWSPARQLLLAVLTMTLLILLLWIAGKLQSGSRFRLLDLAGTQLLARWPFTFAVLPLLVPEFRAIFLRISTLPPGDIPAQLSGSDMFSLTAYSLLALAVTAWTLTLMYRSFAVSCNVKGGKALIVFVVVVLLVMVLGGPLLRPTDAL